MSGRSLAGGYLFGTSLIIVLVVAQVSFAASPRMFIRGPTGLIMDTGFPEAIALAQDNRLYVLNGAGNMSIYYPYFETLPNGSLSLVGVATLNESLPVKSGDTMTYAPNVNTLYVASSQTDKLIAVSTAVSYSNGTIVVPPRIVANVTMPYPTILDCLSGNTLYLLDGYVNNGLVNITDFDTRTNTIGATIGIPLGLSPYSITCGDRTGMVFLSGQNEVALANVTAGTATSIFASISCCGPTLFDQTSGLLYIVQGDNIIALDPSTTATIANISLPQGSLPFALQLDSQDNLIFVGSMLNQIVVVDGNSNSVISSIPTTGVPNPYPVGFTLDSTRRILYTDFLQGAIQVNSFMLENVATQTVGATLTTSVQVTTTQTQTQISYINLVAVESFTLTQTTTASLTSTTTVTTSAPALDTLTYLLVIGTLAALVAIETVYIVLGRRHR